MKLQRFIPFEITSIDSLGQGVSKVTDKVVFIPKTTIGEKGTAVIMSEKKGVVFARAQNIERQSEIRIKPECLHFSHCTSCHFLHIPYEDELQAKKESYQQLFRKLHLPEIEVVGAPSRLGYRNRVQLHYSLNSKLIGMRDSQTFEIIPVPQCLIGEKEIKNQITRLYENNLWLKEAPKSPDQGHVEIYSQNGEVKVTWNRPYADGGFTQVYELMNIKLKNILTTQWQSENPFSLLDLFGGNGNLSKDLNYSERLCVDHYLSNKGPDFFHQDLYDEKSLHNVFKEILKRKIQISHLLLDPPRSGLKNLNEWIKILKPKYLAYVSCDPHTLARDLQKIENYHATRALLIDFFPSTFHFESLIFLERKD